LRESYSVLKRDGRDLSLAIEPQKRGGVHRRNSQRRLLASVTF
jgi:hypothetical protein